MTPELSLNDFGDCYGGNTKPIGQYIKRVGFRKPTDVTNLLGIQFGPSIIFSTVIAVATFVSSVCVVICFRSKKQMLRIAAQFIVAAMKHTKSFRDLTFKKRMGDPMSQQVLTVMADLSVPSLVPSGSIPIPAIRFFSHANKTPKFRLKYFFAENLSRSHALNIFKAFPKTKHEYA